MNINHQASSQKSLSLKPHHTESQIKQSTSAMVIALIVNILGLMLIFASVTQFNRNLIDVQETYSQVQVLHGKVLRIDEVLTMSCWVASTTSDPYWHDRYNKHVPILDETLSELIARTPKSMHSFIEETTAANTILVGYETEALKASTEKRHEHALKLLMSPEYASQKARYLEGMKHLNEALELHFGSLIKEEYEQIKRRELLIFILIFGLAIFWIMIYRTAANWQKTIREYLQISNRMKLSLQERLEDHLQLAEERGLEIKNLRRALLQSEQQERKRLGRLVHDDLQQLIAALRLKSSMYRDLAAVERDRSAYQELVSLADEALTSTRDLVMRLSPPGEHQGSLVEMISAICSQFKQRYGLIIEVDVQSFTEPQQFEVRQLFSRSIRELLFNVVKYAQVDEAHVRLWSAQDYDHCTVSDKGAGFKVDELPTDVKFIRTGLGLLGMREQLTMIGGQIEIVSAVGQGTTITLSIPNSRSTEVSPPTDPSMPEITLHIPQEHTQTGPVLTSSQHRILIVDDNHAIRTMLVQLFHRSPYFNVVGEAGSGPEAVEQAQQTQPDLLLIDYSLPGFDGAEATQRIRGQLPHTKVVGFTSFDIPEVTDHFGQAGVSTVLLKGSDPQDLLDACQQVMYPA